MLHWTSCCSGNKEIKETLVSSKVPGHCGANAAIAFVLGGLQGTYHAHFQVNIIIRELYLNIFTLFTVKEALIVLFIL